jgi:hypothetical protein
MDTERHKHVEIVGSALLIAGVLFGLPVLTWVLGAY